MDVLLHFDVNTREPVGVWFEGPEGTRASRYVGDEAQERGARSVVENYPDYLPWSEICDRLWRSSPYFDRWVHLTRQFGTTLLLHEDELMRELWDDDLDVVAMDGPAEEIDKAAVRRLEIFLDHLLAQATTNVGHLLDRDYEALLSDEERELRTLLEELVSKTSPALRAAPAWEAVRELLADFGHPGSCGQES